MSTKIYGGLRFKSRNIFEIHEQIQGLRGTVSREQERIHLSYLATRCARMIDNRLVRGIPFEGSPLNAATTDLEQRIDKARKQSDPICDVSGEIAIMPFQKRFYAMVFAANKDINNILSSKEIFDEYCYYDNTDRPEEISAREWRIREKVWTGILQPNGWIPGKCSLTAHFEAENMWMFSQAENVLKHIPSDDARVHSLAYDEVFKTYWKRSGKESNGTNIMEGMNWMTKPEAKALVAQEKLRVAPLLPVITKELLLAR